jgi:putative transposase
MIDREADISMLRQCKLIGISRSSYYYEPRKESKDNLKYMRLMDEQYILHPYYGVEQMTNYLRNVGFVINPKRVRRLLRLMGLEAICPGPHTSKPGKGIEHVVFPYLLRGIEISRPGQVLGTDITYIPMQEGFLYLVAYIDWYSRYVLSWELSNSLDAVFCIAALERVWDQVEVEILNTDQGSQFTCKEFVNTVRAAGVKHSMDGKGRAIDNIFTERLWRSLKYEEVYLKSYSDGLEAWESLKSYFDYYNNERPHKHLGGIPPGIVFSGKIKITPIIR